MMMSNDAHCTLARDFQIAGGGPRQRNRAAEQAARPH